MGFLSRWLVEFFLWFGTAGKAPRPDKGLSYPVAEHGVTYYVSASEFLLHNLIFGFWIMFAVGLLIMPARRDADRKRRLYDPGGIYARWRWIGAVTCGLFMLASRLFAAMVVGPA
ncbi:hypothetical protein [Asticcacaulis solisilvae]|uniref:hypothetical protein n=1 Tax=Asticcacaulis solisilvae TaxID=1217274 RepID=UPI003FD7E6C3